MSSIIKNTLLSAGAVLLLTGGAARADASELMTVSVPFPFVVHNQTLPAGQYLLQRDDLDPSVLLIRGANGTHAGTFVLTDAAGGHDPAGDKPCLSFSRIENQYRLASIWESGAEGRVVVGAE